MSGAWLKLTGTRYRCVPLYVPDQQLDPLEQLFLEVLKYEHSVSNLVRAFGLNERIVEDVLGSLLRRNYATLVVTDKTKEIRRSSALVPNLKFDRGEPLDVWQEHSTGIVLPEWMIAPFGKSPHGADRIGRIKGEWTILDEFTTAPDSQLIEMLLRSDEELRLREETSGSLDRLEERYRAGQREIWLRIQTWDEPDRQRNLLAAEDLPDWAVRIWANALQRQSDNLSLSLPTDQDRDLGKTAQALVHAWRIGDRVESWFDTVVKIIASSPLPQSTYQLREVRQTQARLIGALMNDGMVQLETSSPTDPFTAWIKPSLEAASDWIAILIHSASTRARFANLIGALLNEKRALPRRIHILVTDPAGTEQFRLELKRVLPPTHYVSVSLCDWITEPAEIAIGSTGHCSYRLRGAEPSIQFQGVAFATAWLAVLQGMLTPPAEKRSDQFRPTSRVLADLRIYRGQPDQLADGEVRALVVDRPEIAISELKGFQELLITAIVDPRALIPDVDREIVIDTNGSLAMLIPELQERADSIRSAIAKIPHGRSAFWSRLIAVDMLPTLIAVLTEPSRRSVEGHIHIFLQSPPDEKAWKIFGPLVKKAVHDHNWTISIGISEANEEPGDIGSLSMMQKELDSRRFRIRRLRNAVPAYAIVLDDLVFLASRDWSSVARSASPSKDEFCFAIESASLANAFRECFTDAREQ